MSPSPRLWWLSTTLSALVPGLGQVYNGQLLRGAVLFLVLVLSGLATLGWVLLTTTIYLWLMLPLLLVVLLHLAIITDAMVVSRRSCDYQLTRVNRIWVYVVFSVLVLLLLQLTQTSVVHHCFAMHRVRIASRLTGVVEGDLVLVNRLAYGIRSEHDERFSTHGHLPHLLEPMYYLPSNHEAQAPRLGSFLAAAGQRVSFEGPILRLDRSRTVKLPASVLLDTQDAETPLLVPEGLLCLLRSVELQGDERVALDLIPWENVLGRPLLVVFSWNKTSATIRLKRIGIPFV